MHRIDSSATAFAEAVRCETLASMCGPGDPYRRVALDDVAYWLAVAAEYEGKGL